MGAPLSKSAIDLRLTLDPSAQSGNQAAACRLAAIR
jgi:hypothetical protein